MVNSIISHELNHCQFQEYLLEIKAEYFDLPYHQQFDGLVVIKVLLWFFWVQGQ